MTDAELIRKLRRTAPSSADVASMGHLEAVIKMTIDECRARLAVPEDAALDGLVLGLTEKAEALVLDDFPFFAEQILDAIDAITALRASLAEQRKRAEAAEAEGFKRGIGEAARLIRKRLDDYIEEHGIYDPSTGVTEFPGDGDEWVGEQAEMEEAIRALSPEPQRAESMTQAAADVLAERRRQVEVEGFSAEHDDEHDREEIARAAAAYAVVGTSLDEALYIHGRWVDLVRDLLWPKTWDEAWLKPKSRRHNLIKSAALMIAEIERLDRAALSSKPEGA